MATTYKVLGQVQSSASNYDTLYTVPANTSTVCSTMSVCNFSSSASTFSIRIRVNGEAESSKQHIAFNTSISAYDTLLLTFGATLSAGDLVTVYSPSTDVSFQIFGSEIS